MFIIDSVQNHYRRKVKFLEAGVAEGKMIGKLDDYLRFNEAALNLRGQRQQLLASNIANADTPNFKARDIDFNKALQSAIGKPSTGGASAPALVKTSTVHLSSDNGNTVGNAPLLYRKEQQGNIDGNTVNMDVERNQFTDNAIRYEAGLTLINAQIRKMMSAIQGQ